MYVFIYRLEIIWYGKGGVQITKEYFGGNFTADTSNMKHFKHIHMYEHGNM